MIKRIVVELEEEIHQKIKVKCMKENKKMRIVLTKLLMDWLKSK